MGIHPSGPVISLLCVLFSAVIHKFYYMRSACGIIMDKREEYRMWKKWAFWRKKRQSGVKTAHNSEMMELYYEIGQAKREWENARRYFEYALGKDQIDYAIFALGAAEKRYEMLIRRAKALNTKWPAWMGGEVS
jgi:hypothetical protein